MLQVCVIRYDLYVDTWGYKFKSGLSAIPCKFLKADQKTRLRWLHGTKKFLIEDFSFILRKLYFLCSVLNMT